MSRSVLNLSESQIERRFEAGRGSGELSEYQPWIEHYDVSSLGLSSRIPVSKTGRRHQLLSQYTSRAFLDLIRLPFVTDVREHYPLDRAVTRTIAAEMGVPHPVYRNGVDRVLTTDFLISVQGGDGVVLFARAGVRVADLEKSNVLEVLEIERRYWVQKSVQWGLVTDFDRSETYQLNLEWMHGMEVLEDGENHPAYWSDRIASFKRHLPRGKDGTLDDLERSLVSKGLMKPGELINVVRHLCWLGEVEFDFDHKLDLAWPATSLKLSNPAKICS